MSGVRAFGKARCGAAGMARADVGRHNPLDRLIGAGTARGINTPAGAIVLTLVVLTGFDIHSHPKRIFPGVCDAA